jgi:hypothetical protein
MINLLPPELKEAYHYAHRNVSLVRWATACAISLVVLVAISTFGVILVQQTSRSYDQQIAAAQSLLREQQLDATELKVKDISGSLKLAVQVLSRELLFSKLLNRLATITPRKVILTDLNIAQSQQAVDITALTTDYTAATQLQANLVDPANTLFAKADIVTIACGTSGTTPLYPCTATIRALFVKNNPYLFINDGGAKP